VSLDGKHMERCPAFDRHSHRRLSEDLKIEVSGQVNDWKLNHFLFR